MKSYFFQAILLLLVATPSLSVFSQSSESPTEINIDFKSSTIKPDLRKIKLEEGDFYRIRVSNINLNLYKIILEGKDSTVVTNVTFPTFEMVGLDALQKVVAGLSEVSTYSVQKVPDSFVPEKDRHLDTIQDLVGARINAYISFFRSKSFELSTVNQALDSLHLSVQTLALSYLAEKDTTWRNELKSKLNFKSIYSKSEDIRNKLKKISKEVQDSTKSYSQFYEKNKPAIDKDKDKAAANKALVEAFTGIISKVEQVYGSIDAAKVTAWLASIVHLDNNSVPEYRTPPIQLNGDFATVTIKIEPKKEEYGLPKYQSKFSFPAPPKTYIGAGPSFYWATMNNQAFSILATQITDDSTTYMIVNEDIGKSEIGIATLLHYGIKMKNKAWGFHGTIGPALSLNKSIKPRLTAGVGFSLGRRKQMLSFDVIGIAGNVDRLSKAFNTTQVYVEKPDQATVSELSFGLALGIGYIYKF